MSPLNKEIAEKLLEIASLLEVQHANPFRSRAYRHAATTMENLTEDVDSLIQQKGIQGLVELPAIGVGISRSIYEYVALGKMTRLEHLQGASDPVGLFRSIPTVGRTLAERIYHTLHVDTFESLENAARNGQLDKVEGLGEKRKEAIKDWLLTHFGDNRHQLSNTQHSDHSPDIDLLLKVDTEYRDRAKSKKLPVITPKRFNPEHKAWLPILHSTRNRWHFTVMYSNTERAHKLNLNHDWVVIYFHDDHHQQGQHTVVTETHGVLTGKRIVRGREAECYEFYKLTAHHQ
ncbi:MAG: DNA-binding protein [Gammaproteobacteria bacterium]|nr:DNA-binding protein [Gammaproteobacteria bacterium]